MRNVHLLVIDPQNSFCKVVPPDQQQVLHDGELCVQGGWEDMERVAQMIDRLSPKGSRPKLNDIHVTLDSHHEFHIAHSIWYKNSKGNNPDPFTQMRNINEKIMGYAFDGSSWIEKEEYFCTVPSLTQWTLDYLESLEKGGKYLHMIWPTHCLIGTSGHNIVEPLRQALNRWCLNHNALVNYVTKGSNYRVEHFSAVQAEVIDPDDPTTGLNTQVVDMLMQADEILLAGEALSHCLAWTCRNIADQFVGDNDAFIKKCVLLEDASSSVTGFEFLGQQFVDDMVKRGMQKTTTVDYLA